MDHRNPKKRNATSSLKQTLDTVIKRPRRSDDKKVEEPPTGPSGVKQTNLSAFCKEEKLESEPDSNIKETGDIQIKDTKYKGNNRLEGVAAKGIKNEPTVSTETSEGPLSEGNICSQIQHAESVTSKLVEVEFLISPKSDLKWQKISSENLNLDYCLFYERHSADEIIRLCEEQLDYNTGQLAKVKVFNKWHDIPRKQVAFGDPGLSYTFSRNTVPARPWLPLLSRIRDQISSATGHTFNFVLINRYKDGSDYMGEHKDDEKDLEETSPIASLSLGQPRDFLFRHGESRGKNATRKIPPLKLVLEHGSLLLMNYPTNQHWYHSLPVRKRLLGTRINMTFRKMITKAS